MEIKHSLNRVQALDREYSKMEKNPEELESCINCCNLFMEEYLDVIRYRVMIEKQNAEVFRRMVRSAAFRGGMSDERIKYLVEETLKESRDEWYCDGLVGTGKKVVSA